MANPNEDEFWLDQIRKLGSNHAVESFDGLEGLIHSGRLNERQLRSLAGALRSLEGAARTEAEMFEARRRRPWEFRNIAA